MRAAIAALFMLLLAIPALAGQVTELPGLLRHELQLNVVTPAGGSNTLEALVVRPDGPGPFPLVLITHGLPRNTADIPSSRPESYSSPAIVFAQHGYAAVVVMRSGYGRSAGAFKEGLGPCGDRTYLQAGQSAAADVLAALAALRNETWVDPRRILLLGHSMGGVAVLAAAASNPAGVLGTISFAGGVGSPSPDFVCQADRLIAADRTFGQTTHIPSLWVFAENDHFFAPDLARSMFDAYAATGASASLFEAPPFARDGHLLIFAPDGAPWWPRVAAFLATLQLPTAVQVPLPTLPDLAEPRPLDDAGRTVFATYRLSRSYEKAFATDAAGHYGVAYGQRTKADAERAALDQCQRLDRVCSTYAIGNELAPAAAPLRQDASK